MHVSLSSIYCQQAQLYCGLRVYVIYFTAHCVDVASMSPHDNRFPDVKIYQHMRSSSTSQKDYQLVTYYNYIQGLVLVCLGVLGWVCLTVKCDCHTTS